MKSTLCIWGWASRGREEERARETKKPRNRWTQMDRHKLLLLTTCTDAHHTPTRCYFPALWCLFQATPVQCPITQLVLCWHRHPWHSCPASIPLIFSILYNSGISLPSSSDLFQKLHSCSFAKGWTPAHSCRSHIPTLRELCHVPIVHYPVNSLHDAKLSSDFFQKCHNALLLIM